MNLVFECVILIVTCLELGMFAQRCNALTRCTVTAPIVTNVYIYCIETHRGSENARESV